MKKKIVTILSTALALTISTVGTATTAFAATEAKTDILPPWYVERSIITPRDSVTSEGKYMTLEVNSNTGSCSANITNNDSDIERYVTVSIIGYSKGGSKVASASTTGSITTGMRTAMDLKPSGTIYKSTGKGSIYKGKTASTGKLENKTKTALTD